MATATTTMMLIFPLQYQPLNESISLIDNDLLTSSSKCLLWNFNQRLNSKNQINKEACMDLYGRWKGIILIFYSSSASSFSCSYLNLKKINHQVDLCWLCAVCARCFYHHALRWEKREREKEKGDRVRKNPHLVVLQQKYIEIDTKRIGTCSLFLLAHSLTFPIYIWFISSIYGKIDSHAMVTNTISKMM